MLSTCPIPLIPEDARMTTFPIARPEVFAYYNDAKKRYWTIEEISTATDVQQFTSALNDGERHVVKFILAFFAASDGIVNVNLANRFKAEILILEVGYFYNFQIAMEDIHAHTYSMLLDDLVPSKSERMHLMNAAREIPVVAKMTQYMYACIGSDAPLAERLLMMACVEGIFFTGCFCIIYWFQNRGLLPGLGHSNELIAGDEALHTYFAMFLYTMIAEDQQVAPARVNEIFSEAVVIACEFIEAALPVGLAGMNARMVSEYIRSQADNLLSLIDVRPLYNAKHDFMFMEQINMQNRTNFFERRSADYSKRCQRDEDPNAIAEEF